MSEAKTTWVHRTEEGETTPDTATREQLLEILKENEWTAPKNSTREQLLGLVDRLMAYRQAMSPFSQRNQMQRERIKIIEELKALKSKVPGDAGIELAISEIEKNGLKELYEEARSH